MLYRFLAISPSPTVDMCCFFFSLDIHHSAAKLCLCVCVCVSAHVQEFAVPDYRTHTQDPQGRRRPSLLSEFHPGAERCDTHLCTLVCLFNTKIDIFIAFFYCINPYFYFSLGVQI